jgi:formate dehydrogenase major subunit
MLSVGSYYDAPVSAMRQPAFPSVPHNLEGDKRMFRELLSRWPVVKQIQTGGDGTGPEAMSERTRNLGPRTQGAEVARSVCPYCGVGCGQLVYHKHNKLVSIEGDPESPISRGRLCPKGADSFELLTHANRELKVKYRKPFSKKWESLDLETAMDMIADRLWDARERSFVEKQDGQTLMQTKAVAHLGGATLDNEENYLIKKLFTGGLGMVCISNQARI